MTAFFDQVAGGGTVKHKKAAFDLPILYFRDDFFGVFFSADEAKVAPLIPASSLYPVRLINKKVCVAVAAFNYMETSIGPYGEVAVAVPVVYGKKPPPLLPLLREGNFPGFGLLVLHLPVTTLRARDGGRGVWGYPKFSSDMVFTVTPEFMACRLSEGKKLILEIKVARTGSIRHTDMPLITYTVKDRKLIRTVIPQTGLFRDRLFPGESGLTLGDHPVAEELSTLGLAEKPFLARYALERAGILPAGEAVEEGVRALDGFRGAEREGSLKIQYLP